MACLSVSVDKRTLWSWRAVTTYRDSETVCIHSTHMEVSDSVVVRPLPTYIHMRVGHLAKVPSLVRRPSITPRPPTILVNYDTSFDLQIQYICLCIP